MARRSLHHRARVGVVAMALVVSQIVAEREANAACVDVGCIVGWVYVLAVPVVIAGVTVMGIDVYQTSMDIGDAGSHRAPSSGRANFELAFGATQVGVAGTVATAVGADGDGTTAFGLFAFTSWPLALTMHGAWGRRSDPYGAFPSEVLPLAGLDLGVATYDVVRLARRDRPSWGYGFAEFLGALPQVGFGVAAAAGGRGADAPLTLAMTALPALMMAHGAYEMIAKPRAEAPVAAPPAATWRVLPTMGRDARGSTAGVGVVGRF